MKESRQENQSSVENLQPQDQELPSSKNRELRTIDENPDFIEVGMGKFKITRGDSPSPILETIGLGPCVGVVIYDRQNAVGALIHLTEESRLITTTTNKLQKMLSNFSQVGGDASFGNTENLEVTLVTGRTNTLLFRAIEKVLPRLGLQCTGTLLPSDDSRGKNIAFDTRTGEIFDLVNIIPSKS